MKSTKAQQEATVQLHNSDITRIKQAVKAGNFFDSPKMAADLELALGARSIESLTYLQQREIRIALLDRMEVIEGKKLEGFQRTFARVNEMVRA